VRTTAATSALLALFLSLTNSLLPFAQARNHRNPQEPLVRYEYDGNNNRTAMIDGRLNRSVYAYDKANRLTSIDHAGVQTERFTYDSVGNVLRYNDGFSPDIISTFARWII
jgi:YD repeat-containing protein